MVEHLIRLGHRRIGMIKGAAGNHDAAERLRGYRAALRAARIETDRAWEVAGDFSEQSGWQGALALLDLTPRPTAIFAANDSMAIGVLSALGERGLRVPGDVAVAGFDDIPMARYMNPPLSSVHVEIAALGAEATRMLLDRVEHKTDGRPKQKTLPTRLVVRSSCGGASPPDDDSGAGRNRSSRAPRRQAS
jgi:LacI family transcriptional regulator